MSFSQAAGVAVALGLVVFLRWWCWISLQRGRLGRRRRGKAPGGRANRSVLRQPKPLWVRREVVRLKALMPQNGCRKIAITFNHLHAASRSMTVGKTYVAGVVRASQLEIVRKRKWLKHRRPRPIPQNHTWGLDLTHLANGSENGKRALGVLDHGTRACLMLAAVRERTALALLRALLHLVERYGRPKCLRTDNEPVFTSKTFRLGLFLLGIRHQRTAPYAPWQNGRVERFFLTFKQAIRAVRESAPQFVPDDTDLHTFTAWYNHLRPHQHLDGLTPAMAWRVVRKPVPRPRLYSTWHGVLVGYRWLE